MNINAVYNSYPNNTSNIIPIRTDSDVFFPYAEVLHRVYDEKRMIANYGKFPENLPPYIDLYYNNVGELIKGKKYLAAWVVGNCYSTRGARIRMDISQALIDVR